MVSRGKTGRRTRHVKTKHMRRSSKKAGRKQKTKRINRKRSSHKRHQKGGSQVCGPVAPQSGAACNAGSSSNYAITMVGDAYTQMKKSLASMFS